MKLKTEIPLSDFRFHLCNSRAGSMSGGVLTVRRSEANKRNEAWFFFSSLPVDSNTEGQDRE
jgi:hypothetical protein